MEINIISYFYVIDKKNIIFNLMVQLDDILNGFRKKEVDRTNIYNIHTQITSNKVDCIKF